MKHIIVAIDGYSGCGKSSTAKGVAKALDFTYIDSGAMYRAATLHLVRNNIAPEDEGEIVSRIKNIEIDFVKGVEGISKTALNKEIVEKEIRTMEISNLVSKYSKIPALRAAMVEQQRRLSQNRSVVMDGRDIGTVVFPNADLKIFMNADLSVRAKRRQMELKQQGVTEDLELIKKNLLERDAMDSSRENSPLIKADDAIEIDTTNLKLNGQIEMVVKMAREKIVNS